jgi:hypothetical protein
VLIVERREITEKGRAESKDVRASPDNLDTKVGVHNSRQSTVHLSVEVKGWGTRAALHSDHGHVKKLNQRVTSHTNDSRIDPEGSSNQI